MTPLHLPPPRRAGQPPALGSALVAPTSSKKKYTFVTIHTKSSSSVRALTGRGLCFEAAAFLWKTVLSVAVPSEDETVRIDEEAEG